MTDILLVPPIVGIAFFLVVPFLVIVCHGTVIVAFTPILSIILIPGILIILLLQLLQRGFTPAFPMHWVGSQSPGWWWPLIVLEPCNSLSSKRRYDLSLVPYIRCQLMMHKNHQWINRPHAYRWVYLKNKREKPNRGHRWGAGQRPSEG